MAYLLGEALTLRAMIYYDLIKAWGDVPARFEPINSDNIFMAKSSRDTIFVQILKDLEEAIPYLYWPGQSTQTATTDRINKAFACGLYARIALAASGYALRPADGMVGTGDQGSVRKTDEPQLQADVLYPKALKYLQDVINSGTARLESSYEQLWRNFNNVVFRQIPLRMDDRTALRRRQRRWSEACSNALLRHPPDGRRDNQ